MARHPSTITTLPRSPEEEQHSRMIKYSVMMAIRIVCIGLCLVVPGWWLLACVLGAVFLPYVAVLIANAADTRSSTVERPEARPPMVEAGTSDDPNETAGP